MSESDTHQKLVIRLVEHIRDSVGSDLSCFIQADNCLECSLSPQMDDGFRPDAYFEFNDLLIIGEAKTNKDVDRKHSVEQYRSYLRTCQQYHGNATYMMTVPFISAAEANNIVKRLKREIPGDYKVVVYGEIV